MTKTKPVILESVIGHKIEEDELLSVIINGEFKTVVFCRIDEDYYMVIGNTSAYKAACYWNSTSVTGLTLIEGAGEWYTTSKEENEMLYKKILATKRKNKKGRPYYRFAM